MGYDDDLPSPRLLELRDGGWRTVESATMNAQAGQTFVALVSDPSSRERPEMFTHDPLGITTIWRARPSHD